MCELTIKMYGAEIGCASCVGAPTDFETYEWLQSALRRKFPTTHIEYVYINVEDEKIEITEEIEKLILPAVKINGTLISEGTPKLKDIVEYIEGILREEDNTV